MQTHAQAGFGAVGARPVDHARFGRLVQRGTERAEGRGRILFFSRAEQFGILFFQIVQTGFDLAILQALAGAVAHAPFG